MRGTGSDRQCRCLVAKHSTRRGFLTLMSLFGLELAAAPALADPASERPKEGDFLVAAESDKANPLELKDIPLGGPPMLAWPMEDFPTGLPPTNSTPSPPAPPTPTAPLAMVGNTT